MNGQNIADKYTKYYHSKTTDTVLAGLILAESVGYEGLILFSVGNWLSVYVCEFIFNSFVS